MTKTESTKGYKVTMGYGIYFGKIEYFKDLSTAWKAYKEHKEYIMADYATIDRVEITVEKRLFRKDKCINETVERVIEWSWED